MPSNSVPCGRPSAGSTPPSLVPQPASPAGAISAPSPRNRLFELYLGLNSVMTSRAKPNIRVFRVFFFRPRSTCGSGPFNMRLGTPGGSSLRLRLVGAPSPLRTPLRNPSVPRKVLGLGRASSSHQLSRVAKGTANINFLCNEKSVTHPPPPHILPPHLHPLHPRTSTSPPPSP